MKKQPYLAKETIFEKLHPTYIPRPKAAKPGALKPGALKPGAPKLETKKPDAKP